MDNNRTETPLQRVRRLEREATDRGNQLTRVQAERDHAVAEHDRLVDELTAVRVRLADFEDDDGTVRGPLIGALHIFHDRYHGGPFRGCWNDPCGSVDFDRGPTSLHAGPAPTSLPLALVPTMEVSA